MLPAAFVALLLVLATWWEGAFSLRHWAPAALFAIVVVAATLASGGGVPVSRNLRIALVAIWGFAAWTLLSALWAESVALAWEGANRTIMYAALATVALITTSRRRELALLGNAVIYGVAGIAVVTLIRLYVDGSPLFVAGRLDAPVGYRNATAALFAFMFWPLICAAAPRGGKPSRRAMALSLATLALGLAFLTQSRGVLIGLLAGAAVVLALGPDRVRRAWLALLSAVGVAAASPWLLRPYHAFSDGQDPASADITAAAVSLTLIVLVAAAAGLLLALFDNGLRNSTPAVAKARLLARGSLAAGAAACVVVALAAVGNPVDFGEEKLDEFTRLEGGSSGATRLGSVEGQRYDLWRVAANELASRPLIGVGESNYQFDYYEERRTDRNLVDPHSLPLRVLAETGLVGAGLFIAFLAALAAALARSWKSASRDTKCTAAGLAAAGAVILGQSLVDWLWLIPGMMGLGIFCLGIAAAMTAEPPLRSGRRPSMLSLRRAGAAAGLLAAAASVAAVFLSDVYVRKASDEIVTSPGAALDAADTAAFFNPWSVTPNYLRAGAQEDLLRPSEARDELLEALEREPRNFATLGLLGDFEVRQGNITIAQAYYRQALELNPRDIGLQKLAAGLFNE